MSQQKANRFEEMERREIRNRTEVLRDLVEGMQGAQQIISSTFEHHDCSGFPAAAEFMMNTMLGPLVDKVESLLDNGAQFVLPDEAVGEIMNRQESAEEIPAVV